MKRDHKKFSAKWLKSRKSSPFRWNSACLFTLLSAPMIEKILGLLGEFDVKFRALKEKEGSETLMKEILTGFSQLGSKKTISDMETILVGLITQMKQFTPSVKAQERSDIKVNSKGLKQLSPKITTLLKKVELNDCAAQGHGYHRLLIGNSLTIRDQILRLTGGHTIDFKHVRGNKYNIKIKNDSGDEISAHLE